MNKKIIVILNFSCGPDPTTEMISRRRILSRSRDELNFAGDQFNGYNDEEDVWYTKDKLFKVSSNLDVCHF